MDVYIEHLDYYLPNSRLYFKDHVEYFNSNKDFFETAQKFIDYSKKTLGLESVIVETKKTLEEMVLHLLEKNISAGSIVFEEIDYILIAPDLDKQLKDLEIQIIKKYKITKANILRVSQNYCVNIDVAIGMACKLLSKERNIKKILVISGSKLDYSLKERIVGGYGVMGDAAGLILLSGNRQSGILKVCEQNVLNEVGNDSNTLKEGSAFLHLKAYLQCLNSLGNLKDENIDSIILHNANHLLIEEALTYAGLDIRKIYKINQKKYGHLGTTDLILNLTTYLAYSKNDSSILSLNLGISGTYVATIFRKYNHIEVTVN
ncbi:3-oxoacyl-[acyl-carrier-protein] synthase III C-terminal domain-containing protein [Yeosuana marina]|uniref:3-oxoacyl-[acyl-carrier-protein] synthase III C-terminal domain-containing protein n=1 Tax=Yeosuana marina TaxID=1565536 RepID=UPI0030C7C90C